VCAYALTATNETSEMPFVVDVVDKHTGAAELRLVQGWNGHLDCAQRYELTLTAMSCANTPTRGLP